MLAEEASDDPSSASFPLINMSLAPVLLLLLRDFVLFFTVVMLDAVLVAQHHYLAPLIFPCEASTLSHFGFFGTVLFTPEATHFCILAAPPLRDSSSTLVFYLV